MKRDKNPIGYQLVNFKGDYPKEMYSFEIYPLEVVLNTRLNMPSPKEWVLMPIYNGDIEEPVFC